ncbi:hypothetical protein NQ314_001513 [Rhamnusium bicolor]|uniref:SWIM-type domain-containing protein n=1 Tax=Rhamnusium bicolor TaxID=1586634 RepID=A0AAV8ZU00_9CUCU|nr:hypothetical protein NQ314_001513 [Rhamnusium bicolor]
MAGESIISMSAIFEYFKDSRVIRRGENSVKSRFIQNVVYDDDLHMIRGGVHASMKQKIYNVEIFLSSEGDIQKASCNCPKGLDVCHHMASLAIFAHKNLSVTDAACKWSKVKPSQEDTILTAEMCFASSSHPFFPLLKEISEESVEQFKTDLKACGPTGLGWLLSPEPTINEETVVEKLSLTKDRIVEVQKLTVGQTNNPAWYIARKHRLTASNFGQVLKACKRGRFPPTLFQTLTGNTNLGGIKQIQWGRSNESVAIEIFEKRHNVKITKSGIWLDECGFLGASPDGIIYDDTLIEVKCPFKYKDSFFSDCLLEIKDYIVSFNGESFILNDAHNYYHQIQGQLHICGKKTCILALWTTKDYLEIEVVKNVDW